LGYKTKTITSSGMIESVEFLDVGTKLKITPQIKSDGTMIMDIHPEVSEGSIVNELPQKNSTETTTRLLVKDGQTIIIGGLIKDVSTETKKGVPIISDIPFLGVPFRKTSIDIQKREIIILISPHVVDASQIAQMQEPIQKMESRQKAGMGNMPGSLFDGMPSKGN
jgi:type II secretory pathway component GspD/PulD (secretin)